MAQLSQFKMVLTKPHLFPDPIWLRRWLDNGVPPEVFTVRYTSFDSAVDLVRDMGRGCFMAKIDIKHAFRLCPVHLNDWPLLGYKWLRVSISLTCVFLLVLALLRSSSILLMIRWLGFLWRNIEPQHLFTCCQEKVDLTLAVSFAFFVSL